MPDDFDFDGLREHIAGADLQLVVAERVGSDPYTGLALDAGEDLIEEVRVDTIDWLDGIESKRLPVPYDENTLLAEHEVATSDIDVIDEQLVATLQAAAEDRPRPDAAPEPHLIRVYALVSVGGDRAMFVRRQNPVRHLRRNVVTRLLLGSRLAEAPPIFVYDGQFDLVVWRDAVLIMRDTALDSVFLTEELRERQTRDAATALAGALRPGDAAALDAALAADRPFSTKLRKIHRAGHFDRVDPGGWEPTIRDFELGLRVEGGRLALPDRRSGRWILLSLIEDGFVRGAATGAKYRSNSQRVWERRRVTGVGIEDGRVRSLAGTGPWSPRSAAEVIEDIHGRRAEYVVEAEGELHAIYVAADEDGELLVAGEGSNLLVGLPAE
jgi:hypothetical protein